MKGILLAGGSGSRLYPLTKAMSKQLLPIYDKPMIYYPLSILMMFSIKKILIISTARDLPAIKELLGDGSWLGLEFSYAKQQCPEGIAQALTIGDKFANGEDVALILGDNIFYIGTQFAAIEREVIGNLGHKATIFACHVVDPKRFGVVEFNDDLEVLSIEEKPLKPKSGYALAGLYFFPGDAALKASLLVKSPRNEYEITDLIKLYWQEKRLKVIPLKRGNAWLDAGTPDSLMDSGNFVQIIEKRQGLKLACIEEIAYKMGFIGDELMRRLINDLKDGDYKRYLQKVYREKHELY